MQTRCPYASCLHITDVAEEDEFKHINCPNCARIFSARSLPRHLEIDKQTEKHRSNLTLADLHFQQEGEDFGQMVVILEEIRSLWNVGSIFRSADGSGFSHLFLIGITGCPPRREIAKTSLGAEDHVGWSYSGNSLPVVQALKERGYQIVGLEKTAESSGLTAGLQKNLLRKPLCLIVGSETKGIYAETLAECEIVLDLPMRGFKESLNVAVAFGIAAYAISENLEQACGNG